MLLELSEVSRRFGGLQAVTGLSMAVAPGTIHGLIGPNGAGKSTVFNLITGVLPVSSGEIRFRGERISGLRPSAICRRGIARTFQATTLFRESTVLDNVLVAAHLQAERGFLATLLGSARYRAGEMVARTRALALLASLRLGGVAEQRAGALPHRDQKALCLAMALATGADLVILDEPLAGLTDAGDARTPWRRFAPCAPRARRSSSSSTTCARSWDSATSSPGSTTGCGSRRERPARSRATRPSSRPTWGRRTPVLDVTDLQVRYGNVTAVKGISLEVGEGEVVAIIGPNGAGKTSTAARDHGAHPERGRAHPVPGHRHLPLAARTGSLPWGSATPPRAAASSRT